MNNEDQPIPSTDTAGQDALSVLKISPFMVEAYLEPVTGRREQTHSYGFQTTISVGRRGLDERGFVAEVHQLIELVRDSFAPYGSRGPQPKRRGVERRFMASCEQAALGVARVVYDLLGEELAEVTVSVKTTTGLATLEWKKGDTIPVFPKLHDTGAKQDGVSGGPWRWTRHFGAFDVTVLIADNFRCGTPDGVDDSFRTEVSLSGSALDAKGVLVDGGAFKEAVYDHFHPHDMTGTPDALRTEGGSRVFVASCELLTRGVAHVAHKMLGDRLAGVTVSVQNVTGMATYVWRAGDAPPTFPATADRELTDKTFEERQRAIREGRSASRIC